MELTQEAISRERQSMFPIQLISLLSGNRNIEQEMRNQLSSQELQNTILAELK
jgi:hypothetical protein